MVASFQRWYLCLLHGTELKEFILSLQGVDRAMTLLVAIPSISTHPPFHSNHPTKPIPGENWQSNAFLTKANKKKQKTKPPPSSSWRGLHHLQRPGKKPPPPDHHNGLQKSRACRSIPHTLITHPADPHRRLELRTAEGLPSSGREPSAGSSSYKPGTLPLGQGRDYVLSRIIVDPATIKEHLLQQYIFCEIDRGSMCIFCTAITPVMRI